MAELKQFNAGLLKPCCADRANRRPGVGPRGEEGGFRDGPGVTHCVVCECRHAEIVGDPGELGLTGFSPG